jgi:hypothetical protein
VELDISFDRAGLRLRGVITAAPSNSPHCNRRTDIWSRPGAGTEIDLRISAGRLDTVSFRRQRVESDLVWRIRARLPLHLPLAPSQ